MSECSHLSRWERDRIAELKAAGRNVRAIARALAGAAERIGLAVVMLDILDCGDPELVERRRRLYTGYGFQPLPSNPPRLFMPVASILAFVDAATGD
jgi:hypothetical protein